MSASSMADDLDQESKRVQLLYPTYPHAYKILEEIGGGGAGATILKANMSTTRGNQVWLQSKSLILNYLQPIFIVTSFTP